MYTLPATTPPDPPTGHGVSASWPVNDDLAAADATLRGALLDVIEQLARVQAAHPETDTRPVSLRLAAYSEQLADLDRWIAARARYRTACQRHAALGGEECPE